MQPELRGGGCHDSSLATARRAVQQYRRLRAHHLPCRLCRLTPHPSFRLCRRTSVAPFGSRNSTHFTPPIIKGKASFPAKAAKRIFDVGPFTTATRLPSCQNPDGE